MSFSGVLGLEEQELGHDQVGDVVLDRITQEDDAVLEEPAVDRWIRAYADRFYAGS
jgi:hypothetical protein